jgi:hypothetical protein
MRFTVGGESFDLTKERIIAAMKDAPIETIQKHVVEIDGQAFPPKQVFATVTGRARTSFTTMEAQRVLRRLGFVCREAGRPEDGAPAWIGVEEPGDEADTSVRHRLSAIEATQVTLEAAVAGLHARVKTLEADR